MLFPTFQLFLLPLFLVGFAGILYSSSPADPDAIMPHIMLTVGLPPIVVGIFCAGALAASMSTGDALVHGAASIAVTDVYGAARGNALSQHDQRRLIRWLAVAVGVVAYALALPSGLSLVGMLLGAYGAIVQLAPPVYAAFLWRRATAPGVIAGLLVGISTAGLLILRPEWKPFGLHEGLVGLAANIVALAVVSMASRPPARDHVSDWMATSRNQA
jgi:SSS family solute:Na+ symporter